MNDSLQLDRAGSGVALALAAISVGTGATGIVATGSASVGFGALLVALALATVGVTAPDALEDAWAEHRPYVGFATGLFAFGALLGVALYLAGYDLLDIFLEMLGDEFPIDEEGGEATIEDLEIELTAQLFISQNTPPYLASIFGAITLGVVTAIVMVFNGILVGNIAFALGAEEGFGLVFALLAPHGIFELPALFLAAGVGFRLVHRFGQRLFGSREAVLTKPYLYRTGVFVLFGWLVLVLAAFVEAYVTFSLAELLVGNL